MNCIIEKIIPIEACPDTFVTNYHISRPIVHNMFRNSGPNAQSGLMYCWRKAGGVKLHDGHSIRKFYCLF